MDKREQTLDAEAFIREAASELKSMQERSAALSNARTALLESTGKLDELLAAVRASSAAQTESQKALVQAVSAINNEVGRAMDGVIVGFVDRFNQAIERAEERVGKGDSARREAFTTGLENARRSVLDSAQSLTATATGIAGNIKLLAEHSALERERWKASFLEAQAVALAELKAAGAQALDNARRANESTNEALGRISQLTDSLVTTSTAVNRAALRIQEQQLRAFQAPAPQMRTLYLILGIQVVLFFGELTIFAEPVLRRMIFGP